MVGYGSDQRGKLPKNCYGTRSTGKKVTNGGFNYAPVVDFTSISDDRWINIFGDTFLPKWKRELLEKNEHLD
jgi:hypothetical protein